MSITRRTFLQGTAAVALGAGTFRHAGAAVPGAAEWERVLKAGRADGEVVFYSSGIARLEEPKMKEFEGLTGIKVKYARPGGGEIVIRKFETEVGAGKPLADVCTLTDSALGLYAVDKGWVADPAIPNLAKLDKAFPLIDPRLIPTGAFGLVIAYNRNLLPKERAPKSYADLIKPQYKDQVILGAPENAGSTTLMIAAWVEQHGWGYVEKLRANNASEMRLQAEAMQAVARGEKPICVVAQSWVFLNQTQGAPVEVVWPTDGTVMADTALFIAKNGPHPNAGLVLANYLISAEYQGSLGGATGAYGSAAGIAGPTGYPKLADVKAYRPDLRKLVQNRGEIIDRWRKIMS